METATLRIAWNHSYPFILNISSLEAKKLGCIPLTMTASPAQAFARYHADLFMGVAVASAVGVDHED
jgi:hypothetical protein